ncbi:VPLPA-CTERM sorting domain-containing protein [Desulfococcus multivorans]|uniref:VPLPA-CTERM sorting domain-containing protein n=1 Tax=Desulfococcus multivorans TaxID=897 RepID=UPI001294795F
MKFENFSEYFQNENYGPFNSEFSSPQFKPVDDLGAFYYTVNIYGEQNTSPVPVPCSLLLLGTGLAGLAGTRLRRKKR